MKKYRKIFSLIMVLLLALTLTAGCGSQESAQQESSEKTAEDAAVNTASYEELIFDTSFVHTIEVTMSEEDRADQLANPKDKTKYQANVVIDGEEVKDVAFHTKGNSSLFFTVDAGKDKFSYGLNFGKFTDGGTFHGLDKLNLQNNIADASSMREYMAFWLFRRMGVDAPLYCLSRAKSYRNGLLLMPVNRGIIKRKTIRKGNPSMSTRGIYTVVSDIRKRVFAEIAKLSYNYKDGDLSELEQIPYRIIPGEISTYRESIFLEREIVKERMRLALGLNLRPVAEHAPVSLGAEECVRPEKYYEPPLINVISFACNACPDNVMRVSDLCQGCLAHPCREVCPKDAIRAEKGKSVIDESKCIKCGKCMDVCPYHAIVRLERPCAKACGVNAIGSDEYGRAKIDQEKCVKCGMCFANCPFGAIADKSQIFQTIQAIRSETPVYAAIAPAFTGQFGPDMTMKKIRAAFKALGFKDAVEVAIGADLCTIQEAEDFVKEVPDKLAFMGTSCCPAWSSMAKKLLPGQENHISMALTPMVLTARLIKQQHPECKVAFIGPCAAKKVEAIRKHVRSEVDFVLTFEEVWGMFEAKNINFAELEDEKSMHGASGDGRGFAVSGGVAEAVANRIKECYPDVEVKIERAEGLADCKKMLALAKAGKYNGYLLEGMACPHGCVGGAGTVMPIEASKKAVEKNKAGSTHAHSSESSYQNLLDILTQE